MSSLYAGGDNSRFTHNLPGLYYTPFSLLYYFHGPIWDKISPVLVGIGNKTYSTCTVRTRNNIPSDWRLLRAKGSLSFSRLLIRLRRWDRSRSPLPQQYISIICQNKSELIDNSPAALGTKVRKSKDCTIAWNKICNSQDKSVT